MTGPARFVFFLAASCLAFATLAPASVVFRPKEGAKYVAPGDEEVSGNARELYEIGTNAARDGNSGRAIKAYRRLVAKHPNDALASSAQYELAVILEKNGDDLKAAQAYRVLVEKFPKNSHFDEAIEAQFRIGERYLEGKKLRLLGVPLGSSMDKVVEIFSGIVADAPYGKLTARAQFDIGRAREKQGSSDLAIQSYQAVVDKFPTSALAVDAQYQIGYIWMNTARSGSYDANASTQARTAFQDFLFRYPNSEKSAQARENLRLLNQKQTRNSYKIAKFYDKQKNYKAAVVYYTAVMKEQPGSDASEEAKRRVAQLRAKFGDGIIPVPGKAVAKTTMGMPPGPGASSGAGAVSAPYRGAGDVPPLPPSESDPSLPPPASLDQDTAPGAGVSLGTEASPSPSPTPSPSP